MRIILVHGYKSSSQGQFFPWLKDELRRKGHEVVALDFPNPEAPESEEWFKLLEEEVCPLTEDDILVGHSLGGAMLLRFLDNAEARTLPKGVVTVATPWFINHEQLRAFFPMDFDYEVIMWKAKLFTVIHSKDDKIVPFNHAEKYQKMLHATLVETQQDGHFQGAQYPVILQEIQKIIDAKIEYAPGESLNDQFSGLH